METEISNNLIIRGLRKFSLRIYQCSYIISSKDVLFCYDLPNEKCENKFFMPNLHFSVEIYNGKITIYYNPLKKLCSITRDDCGELHFAHNEEMNTPLYYSTLFKFLYSCSDLIADDVCIDNDGICKWVNNTLK